MKKLYQYFKNVLLVILILMTIWVFAGESTQTMPKYAKVLVSDNSKLYYSPTFLSDYRINTGDSLRLSTSGEAKLKKYKAHTKCRNEGYFTEEQGSPIWGWLDSAGIWKQKHRWNPDGSWNW